MKMFKTLLSSVVLAASLLALTAKAQVNNYISPGIIPLGTVLTNGVLTLTNGTSITNSILIAGKDVAYQVIFYPTNSAANGVLSTDKSVDNVNWVTFQPDVTIVGTTAGTKYQFATNFTGYTFPYLRFRFAGDNTNTGCFTNGYIKYWTK